MSEITKGLEEKDSKTKHGVPKGAADAESHGGYGGTDRLKTETGPLQPEVTKGN